MRLLMYTSVDSGTRQTTITALQTRRSSTVLFFERLTDYGLCGSSSVELSAVSQISMDAFDLTRPSFCPEACTDVYASLALSKYACLRPAIRVRASAWCRTSDVLPRQKSGVLFREIWIDTVCWTLSLKDKDQENAKRLAKCIGDIESRSEDF